MLVSSVWLLTGRPAFLYFPIFLSVPIIFLYFDEIPIFSCIIFTPKKCRDARVEFYLYPTVGTGISHDTLTRITWSRSVR